MFDMKKIKDLILVSLVADSYSLGSHWVYDEKQLAKNLINWDTLNAPLAIWHKGKMAGEFTHYGDQTLWLYEYLKDKTSFDAKDYAKYWFGRMQTYNGYIDSASKQSMQNIANGIEPTGSQSTDLSIVGRIAPLLLVSSDKTHFLQNVEKLVRTTHNSSKAINAAKFFAKLLFEILVEKKTVIEAIEFIKDDFDSSIQLMVEKGLESASQDTYEVIRHFGPACDIDDGFSGVIHLLSKYNNLKQMLVENAKAGGDTSSRAMIASIIFMANKPTSQIPQAWLAINAQI